MLGVVGAIAVGCATGAGQREAASPNQAAHASGAGSCSPKERRIIQLCPGARQAYQHDRTFPRLLGPGLQPRECVVQPHARTDGQVLIEAVVDAQGRLTRTRITHSSPPCDMTCMQKAVLAFLPAMAQGVPIQGTTILACEPAPNTQ